jgi:hypothetical protein
VWNTGSLPQQAGLAGHALGDLFGVGSYIGQRGMQDTGALVTRAHLLGATWVREELTASLIHASPDGPYDWSLHDRAVDAERRAGLHVLGLLDYSNTRGLGDPGTMPHADMPRLASDFAAFAYAAARHFRGRVRYWEVWNEPNIATFWHPQPDAADYALLLTAAYTAIKRADPAARVVLAGTSGVDLTFIRAVAAQTKAFDVVAVHPYRGIPETDLVQQVEALKALGKPVWFTEIGWPAGAGCAVCTDLGDQAAFLVRFYALAAATGVQRIFWYDLRDDRFGAAPEETHFGLLRRDFSGKPAARAYAFLATTLHSGTFQHAYSLGQDGVYALSFGDRARPIAVIWNTGTAVQTVRLPWKAPMAVAVSLTGDPLGEAWVSGGTVSWPAQADGRPVYLLAALPRRTVPAFLPLSPPVPARAVVPGKTGRVGKPGAARTEKPATPTSTAIPTPTRTSPPAPPTATVTPTPTRTPVVTEPSGTPVATSTPAPTATTTLPAPTPTAPPTAVVPTPTAPPLPTPTPTSPPAALGTATPVPTDTAAP